MKTIIVLNCTTLKALDHDMSGAYFCYILKEQLQNKHSYEKESDYSSFHVT